MQLQPVPGVGTDYASKPELVRLQVAQMGLQERNQDVQLAQQELARQEQRVESCFEDVIHPISDQIRETLQNAFAAGAIVSLCLDEGQLSLTITTGNQEQPLQVSAVRQKVDRILQQVICGDDDEASKDSFALDCQSPDGDSFTVSLALRPKMLEESEPVSATDA